MTCVEHYFENLLFHGEDVRDGANKNQLSKEVQEAVEACASYVKYTLCNGNGHFHKLFDPIKGSALIVGDDREFLEFLYEHVDPTEMGNYLKQFSQRHEQGKQ